MMCDEGMVEALVEEGLCRQDEDYSKTVSKTLLMVARTAYVFSRQSGVKLEQMGALASIDPHAGRIEMLS